MLKHVFVYVHLYLDYMGEVFLHVNYLISWKVCLNRLVVNNYNNILQ